VPTFVSAHTFCASRKPWFKRHAHAGVDIDAVNYKYTTKMKAKEEKCWPTRGGRNRRFECIFEGVEYWKGFLGSNILGDREN